MIPTSANVAGEILALSHLLDIPARQFCHVTYCEGAAAFSAAAATAELMNYVVPDGFFLLLTSIEACTAPNDAADVVNDEARQPGFFTNFYLKIEGLHPEEIWWPNIAGKVLFGFLPGRVIIKATFTGEATAEVVVTSRISGFLVAGAMPDDLGFMTTRSIAPL